MYGTCANHKRVPLLRNHGQGEGKGRAFSRSRIGPDLSPVPLDDSLADGKSNTGTGILCSVQPLEDPKNSLSIAWIKSDAVVLHREHPLRITLFGADVNCRSPLGTVFHRIANKIL